MNVLYSGEYTIAVSQKDKRCLPLSSKYEYSHITVSIIEEKVKDKITNYVYQKGEKTSWKRDTYVPFDSLKKGKYWVLVKVKWVNFDAYQNDLTFSINNYGCSHVNFTHDKTTDHGKFIEVAENR